MYQKFVKNSSQSAINKKLLFESSISKYFAASMIAGFFIGMGMLTMCLSNSVFSSLEIPAVKFINGFVFSLALSLVVMGGGELFTGNVLVMSTGILDKKCGLSDLIKIWTVSYIGNFAGALVLSLLFIAAHQASEPVGDAIVAISIAKSSQDFTTLLFKGILCNIMVCLGVLICLSMKSESGKLIMIFWCIMPFVALGFEHCVANMTCFIFANIVSNDFNTVQMLHNLVPVTVGNIIGGLLVSFSYYFVARE